MTTYIVWIWVLISTFKFLDPYEGQWSCHMERPPHGMSRCCMHTYDHLGHFVIKDIVVGNMSQPRTILYGTCFGWGTCLCHESQTYYAYDMFSENGVCWVTLPRWRWHECARPNFFGSKTPSFIRLWHSIMRHLESMFCHIKEVVNVENSFHLCYVHLKYIHFYLGTIYVGTSLTIGNLMRITLTSA
jgi:hypothetical protein